MKKKIKDLTLQERLRICDKYVYNKCDGCPFKLEIINSVQDSPIAVYSCAHHILNLLSKKVEVDE